MSKWISYQIPAVQELFLTGLDSSGVRLLIWREDQNHPQVSGNKWWKLKYNIQHAIENGYDTVLTFGGAYSNHLYATAAACFELGLKSIGIIRGEEIQPLNETLAFVRTKGMTIEFISREDYRDKANLSFLQSLEQKFGKCFIVPEGGTNALAMLGTEELGGQLRQYNFDYLCLPVGTGGTIAGIINAFRGERKIIGVPVLKNGEFLNDEIAKFLTISYTNWELKTGYHFGGYAKSTPELLRFIAMMKEQNVPLEFVYSGKLVWAVVDLVKKGFFGRGSTVMILHTGGLRNG